MTKEEQKEGLKALYDVIQTERQRPKTMYENPVKRKLVDEIIEKLNEVVKYGIDDEYTITTRICGINYENIAVVWNGVVFDIPYDDFEGFKDIISKVDNLCITESKDGLQMDFVIRDLKVEV